VAKTSVSTFTRTPGMMLVLSFFTLFGVNAVLLYLANMFFPQYIVLGTQSMNMWWAILHSMGTLALFLVLLLPFATILERHLGRELKPQEWIAGYFVANFIGLWTLARFSDQFGMGLSAWYVAAGLAVVIDLVQGMVMMQFEKLR
jgi:hypothetical protein